MGYYNNTSNSNSGSDRGYQSQGSGYQSGPRRDSRGGGSGRSFGGGGFRGGYRGQSNGNRGAYGNRGGSGRGFGGGGRTKGRGEYIEESRFIKKAQPISETAPYVSTFKFPELNVSQTLKNNIVSKGYIEPTPIQDQSIQHIMQGKDVLGIANTGTGKTAAFLIPLIEKVTKNSSEKVLIIVPTRELAQQINDELYSLTRDLRVYSVQCIGGASMQNQIYNLRRGFNFVVGTPGRLKDLVERRVLNLGAFSTVVLDEVDRMLDMGFIDDIKSIISFLANERQSLFFSATMNPKIERVIDLILKKDFVKVSVKTGETALHVDQDVVRVSNRDEKISKLKEMLSTESFEKVLVFVNTKREVDNLEKHFYTNGISVVTIHGDKRQRERQRAIESFKFGKVKALFATDVAARGLDISDVSHVINYDIPMTYEDYIHRIGRTGRANKAGIALTFVEKRGY